MYSGTPTARRSFGTQRDDVRPQGVRTGEEKKMSDMESKPGDTHEEILRELHAALDLTETHLKRITKPSACEANPVDLLIRLRQSVTTQMSGHRRTAG